MRAWRTRAPLVGVGDAEPLRAGGREDGRAEGGAMAVGVGLDDGEDGGRRRGEGGGVGGGTQRAQVGFKRGAGDFEEEAGGCGRVRGCLGHPFIVPASAVGPGVRREGATRA